MLKSKLAKTRLRYFGRRLSYVIKDDQNNGTVVDTTVTVNVGEDGIPGTNDDTYAFDADNDGQNELVHVGVDGIPGTADDWYEKDVNGDGENETVYAGEDGIFDTTDDWYPDVVGGKDVEVIAGEDGKIGTAMTTTTGRLTTGSLKRLCLCMWARTEFPVRLTTGTMIRCPHLVRKSALTASLLVM